MKTVVITGASSDIGKEICIFFGQRGYRLVCQFFSEDITLFLSNYNFSFVAVKADFSNNKGLLKFMDYLDKNVHSIDVLIHCAAQVEKKMKNVSDIEMFSSISNINLYAPIAISKHVAAKMMLSDNANVVFISSTYSKRLGSIKSIYYASTKTALLTVSRIFAREFKGIRYNVIVPGFVDTSTYRLNRSKQRVSEDKNLSLTGGLVSSSQVSATVGFIVDNAAINASVVDVDGGLCL